MFATMEFPRPVPVLQWRPVFAGWLATPSHPPLAIPSKSQAQPEEVDGDELLRRLREAGL